MAKKVEIKFIRSDGRTFAFDDSPMGITALKGVDAPTVEIFTEKQAIGDGDIITGKRVASRSITITAANRMPALNSQMRKIASAFFNPLYTYTAEFTYDGSTMSAHECELKAIAIPTGNVYRRLEITLTLLSPTGYLDGGGLYGRDINSVQPRLGWPWVSVAGVGHLYSLFNFARAITVQNDGDAPTFIRAVFTASGPDTVENPKLISGESFIRVMTTLHPGDALEINTEKKQAKLNGVSVLHLVDKASSWAGMRMNVGQNTFGFAADSNDNQLSVRIYYTKRYYGLGG